MTFSIVGRSADGQSWGVAVASKFLAVGSAVPAAVAGIGALATQADANVAWKGIGLSLLDEGATASATVQRLVEDDAGRDHRQIGVVDGHGGAASYTSLSCLDWAGGTTLESASGSAAIQGNVLTGPEVIEAMATSWTQSDDSDLARRLLAALRAGDEAGGDRRGRQSAALLVVREGAGYNGGDDIACDLRVDDHATPLEELTRLLDLNDLYLTSSTEAEMVEVDEVLAAELEQRAQDLGHADFHSWVGCENYEMRVDRATPPRVDRPQGARHSAPAGMTLTIWLDPGSVTTGSGDHAARAEESPTTTYDAVLDLIRGTAQPDICLVDRTHALLCWDAETGGVSLPALAEWDSMRGNPLWPLLASGRVLAGPLHSYVLYRLTRGLWHLWYDGAQPEDWPFEIEQPEPWPADGVLTDPTITGHAVRIRAAAAN